MKKVELLFDALRSPYDMAHIIQVAQSIDAKVYTAGITKHSKTQSTTCAQEASISSVHPERPTKSSTMSSCRLIRIS